MRKRRRIKIVYAPDGTLTREEYLKALQDLTNLTREEFSDLESKLFKLGYRHGVSKEQAIIYNYLGEEQLALFEQTAFTYTCIEAEYLKIDKHSLVFKELNGKNRANLYGKIIASLPYLLLHTYEFIPLSEEEMRRFIIKKYQPERNLLEFKVQQPDDGLDESEFLNR